MVRALSIRSAAWMRLLALCALALSVGSVWLHGTPACLARTGAAVFADPRTDPGSLCGAVSPGKTCPLALRRTSEPAGAPGNRNKRDEPARECPLCLAVSHAGTYLEPTPGAAAIGPAPLADFVSAGNERFAGDSAPERTRARGPPRMRTLA